MGEALRSRLTYANVDALRTISAFDENTSDVNLDATISTVTAASLVTPASGRVLVMASAEIEGGGATDLGNCRVDIDGTDSDTYEISPAGDGLDSEIVGITFARNVSAGPHVGSLECTETGGSLKKDNAAISTIFVPSG